MKTYDFDFSVDLWVKNLEIDANSEEEAKEKLVQMKLEDILEEGFVKDFEISNIDSKITYAENEYVKVRVYDLIYDDGQKGPSEFNLELELDGGLDEIEKYYAIEEAIKDQIYDQIKLVATNFEYDILSK